MNDACCLCTPSLEPGFHSLMARTRALVMDGIAIRSVVALGGGIALDTDLHMRTGTGASSMAEHDEQTSIPGLIKGLLDDARDLIREELQLARAEIREEVSALQTVTIAFAVAAVVGLLGAMLLSVALGGALACFLRWPP